jgi:acetoin utilization deacetylase AcuC-like enzyme
LERVAVVDIDVHFGNGTADILKNDPKAFFASIHMIYGDMNNGCYDLPDDPPHAKRAGFYPPLLGTAETTNNYISVGILPSDVHASVAKERYRGNTGFRKALTEVVIPKLELFNPQLLIISAGFDGYNGKSQWSGEWKNC